MNDGQYRGVIDRIVDGRTAVILLEDENEVIEQFDVPIEDLPDAAQTDGAVLEVTVENSRLADASYLSEETENRSRALQDRLDRLSEPLSEDEACGQHPDDSST